MARSATGDLVLQVTADTTRVGIGMRRGREAVSRETSEMKVAISKLSGDFGKLGTSVSGIAPIFAVMGSQGAGAISQIGSSLSGLTQIVAGGGLASALGTGIVVAIAKIAESLERTRAAAMHMKALNSELGVTSSEVDAVEDAFNRAGASIERLAAQQMVKLGREAGLTSSEVAGLADRVKRLADLDGIDPASAASKYFAEMAIRAEELVKKFQAAREAIRIGPVDSLAKEGTKALDSYAGRAAELEAKRESQTRKLALAYEDVARARKRFEATGTRGFEREWDEAFEKANKLRTELSQTESDLRAVQAGARAVNDEFEKWRASVAAEKAAKELERQKALWAELARARRAATLETNVMEAAAAHDEEGVAIGNLMIKLAALDERRKAGRISAEDAARQTKVLYQEIDDAAAEAAKALVIQQTDVALKIKQIDAELTGDRIRQIELRRDAEVAALERRKENEKAIAGELGQMQVQAEQKAAQEIERIRLEQQRRAEDFDRETAAIRAIGIEDDLAAIQARADQELLIVQRLEEDKTITVQQAEERRQAIRMQADRQIATAAARQRDEAMVAGAQFGAAMVQGFRSAMESDDFKSAFKAFLQIAGAIASIIPGGQAVGMGLNIFAGMFAQGGLIGGRQRYAGAFAAGGSIGGRYVRGPGTGTSDDVIIRASNGEFVSTEKAVRRYGVRFFEGLNRGEFDLQALPKYAGGGVVGMAAAPATPAAASPRVSLEQHVSFQGSIMSREILMREMGPALRQMAIEATSSVIRQLGLRPGAVTARG